MDKVKKNKVKENIKSSSINSKNNKDLKNIGDKKVVKKDKNVKNKKNIIKNKKNKDEKKTGSKFSFMKKFFVGNEKNKKTDKSIKNKNEKIMKFEGKFSLDVLDLLIIVVITSIVSCVLCGLILNYQFKKASSFYNKEITSNQKIDELLKTYSEIVDNYYEEVDKDAMIEAAISGMLDYLQDNYSIFLDKDDTDSLSNILENTYKGIGIVSLGNVVYNVYKNSPADKAGIKENDVIIRVNDVEIDEKNYDKISELIHENLDGKNEVVVKRDDEELVFELESATIYMPVTATNIFQVSDSNIGYLSLSTFSSTSFDEFKESLEDLEENGIDSLIIDLRDNKGGYLDMALNISNLFLEKGKVIYSLESKNKVKTYKDDTNEKRDYDIVVLVNSATASAAEILATSLKDSYGATIVGKRTYGKGKVQTMMHYKDTMMKYTSAKWLRPNGECIDEVGIKPDYDVDVIYNDEGMYDIQLEKAIELLS